MGVGEWIAMGGLGLTVLGGIVSGVVFALKQSYKDGQKDQRMAQIESDMKGMHVRLDEHAQSHQETRNMISTFSAAFESIKLLVGEVRADVKELMRERRDTPSG